MESSGLVSVGHLTSARCDTKETFKTFNHILSACLPENLVEKDEADELFDKFFLNLV